MNNLEEIMQAISIITCVFVAAFLLNTGRALKAIDLCKESLVLLNNKIPSTQNQFGQSIYRKTHEIMFRGYLRISDNTNAITYGRKLLTTYSECGDTVQEGILSVQLAEVYYSQSMYVKAKELYERAVIAMRKMGDRAEEATCYNNLGTVCQSLGEFVTAKEYLEKALAIRIQIGDRLGRARCYRNLGNVFQSLGENVKVKEYLEKALAIFKKIGARDREAASYHDLGIVFQSLGDSVKAKEYLEKALAIFKDIGDRD